MINNWINGIGSDNYGESFQSLFLLGLSVLLVVAAAVIILWGVYLAILQITAQEDAQRAAMKKKWTNYLIGIVILIFLPVIISAIIGMLFAMI